MEGRAFTPPTMSERIETALSQMRQMIEEKGLRVGFAESKKQMSWYIHGVKGAAEARGRMMTAADADEVERILRGLI
jgi:tRNA-dihydrouridine synthase